jgi:hypothetical protein
MKLYRFSPIQNEAQLRETIEHIHFACYQLCKDSFGVYLPNAGNVGVFCHYDDEYERLVKIREQLCLGSDDPNQKYFKLHKPIVIPKKGDIPETAYTHLYIRKPDIYRSQVGDIDFYIKQAQYELIKQKLMGGGELAGGRVFPRQDLDMIELFNPDVDALAYVSTSTMAEKVRIKLSNETHL